MMYQHESPHAPMMQQQPYYGHPQPYPPPYHHPYYSGYGMPHMHHHPQMEYYAPGHHPTQYPGSPFAPSIFASHKPPIPHADILDHHHYHQYMYTAAAKWYENQHLRHKMYMQRNIDTETSSVSDVASSSSKGAQQASPTNTRKHKKMRSRLPPPVPPPPEFIQEKYFG